MQYEIEVNGRVHRVVLRRIGEQFSVVVDGRALVVDAARIGTDTLSLLVREAVAPGSAEPTAERTQSHDVVLTPGEPGQLSVSVGPVPLSVSLNGARRARGGTGLAAGSGPERIVAPMPGRIVRVLVGKGEAVRARQGVVVMEAMKMENELRAARDGVMSEVHVADGQLVEAGSLLAVIGSA